MIHQYKSNGYNIVMDVNSGSVHVVDDIVYDMIPLVEPLVTEGIKDADTIKAAVLNLANIPYPQEEITEAVDEVLELEKAGQLFAPDIYENYIFDFFDCFSFKCIGDFCCRYENNGNCIYIGVNLGVGSDNHC